MENLSTYFILFIIYSFLGWVVEVINCSIVEKKVVNRGFLISPICPIYGCGAILITLVLSNYKDDWFVVFCMAVILCGLLEYLTSWLMEKLFHARWWDYSNNKFNINGRVCLETMIPFGILGLIIIYVLNPFFYNLLSYIPSDVSKIISLVLFIILIADMIISCNVISKVTSTVKNVAAQNKKDNTYEITRKARELLKTNWKGKRLLDAFPNLETIKEKVKKVANYTSEKVKIIIAISIIAVIILTLALTIAIINDMKRQKYVAYNGENLAEEKYSGYKALIDELKSKHPNWNFILFYTKLDWNEVITNEGHSDMRTNPLNLIPDYMEYPENWVCEIDKDKTFDNGHWLCASNIAIAHQMDPRNILTEENIFQFKELNFTDGVYTVDGMSYITDNTFLEGESIANTLIEACKNANLDAYFVASRLIQEQGRDGTMLSKGYEYNGLVVYNPFNIKASGNSAEEILTNSAEYAYEQGWDSLEKALLGGIDFVKDGYINVGQNNLYLQKFDVVNYNSDQDLYEHQYMQNLFAPESEASNMKEIYENSNSVDGNYNFIIPLYENLPGQIQ